MLMKTLLMILLSHAPSVFNARLTGDRCPGPALLEPLPHSAGDRSDVAGFRRQTEVCGHFASQEIRDLTVRRTGLRHSNHRTCEAVVLVSRTLRSGRHTDRIPFIQ